MAYGKYYASESGVQGSTDDRFTSGRKAESEAEGQEGCVGESYPSHPGQGRRDPHDAE